MANLPPLARLPLLMLGMIALVVGSLAGLARLGVEVPVAVATQAGSHGALMIAAFFGTVISLERAVALGRGWPYGAPLAAGLGGLALLLGAPLGLAQGLFTIAAMLLTAASAVVIRQHAAVFTVVLGAGAGCWLLGNLAWIAGGTLPDAAPWWLAFLIFTIAGERLELTRFLPTPPGARRLFIAAIGVTAAGAAIASRQADWGLRLFAAGLLALSIWLLRHDIARRNVRQQGLTRFIAVCLLSGYAWLALGGLLGLAGGLAPGHAWRDAAFHSITLGFVLSMVFGHAPIIFPAVIKVKIPYHPAFYLPLIVLQASLLLRVAANLAAWPALLQRGALVNVLALALFIATMLASVVRGRGSAER